MKSVLSRISPLPRFRLTTSSRHQCVQGHSEWPGNCVRSDRADAENSSHQTRDRTVVFTVSGQLGSENVNELCQLVDVEPAGSIIVLDLTDLVLADRDAVRFLREYEARGRVVLRNCPAYVRTWMVGENDRS